MTQCLPRPATRADLDALVALEAATFNYSQIGRQSFQRLMQRPSAQLYVVTAEDTGQLLGYSLILTRKNSRIWRLYSLAVACAARGQGIGRILLEHALQQATSGGAQALSLEVKCDNAAAIALYRDYGFEVVDLLPDYYPGHDDGYRMRLSFT
ncbi:GNAT family N-acetyltransferase [Pseudidiomarina sediminum]|uniref:GNAT family N-acetyltransferase n=1 Tax=Pseudidiomarina sediminum TaxID=431675 RepID=A0A432Z0W4_9GAMM|nr:N-acetyltransferase [Pseudidiomarina sediminum]RUO69814.1 GNAT family N-acetyltransferase [Pseudidiomarina sediminum]